MAWAHLALLVIVLCILLDLVISTWRFGISPMPSNPKMRQACLGLANTISCERIYVAGSGWGGLASQLARARPHTQVIGIEGAWIPWLYTLLRYSWFGSRNLNFTKQTLATYDYENNSLVVAYLYPVGTQQLFATLKKAAPLTFISLGFAVDTAKPVKVINTQDFWRSPVYVYDIK